MKTILSKRSDTIIAIVFGALTLAFILLMVLNENFFKWAWNRHHNLLSWYIRPIMLVPFMYFAYKRSYGGMSFSIFALATSMAWFPVPEVITQDATDFLAMELEYLTQDITLSYVLLWLIVPLVFVLLGAALWKRSFLYGGFVLIGSMILKVIWSAVQGGESAGTLFQAAIFGLVATLILLYFGYRRNKKKANWKGEK